MLKVGVVIIVVVLIYGALPSLMAIITPSSSLKGVMQPIGKTVEDARNDGYLGTLMLFQRTMAIYSLLLTMSGFFVLFAAFRKAQQWAWWALLILGGIAWIYGLIVNIVLGDNIAIIMELIGTALLLLGLFLPVKEFFGRASAEA